MGNEATKGIILIPVFYNEQDNSRCSIACRFCEKITGTYHCTITHEEVDTGDDDDFGYGFKRTDYCIKNSMKTSSEVINGN